MRRRAAKVDVNQQDIVRALEAVGASVLYLHVVGAGVPDLLVGYKGRNYLIEVKRPLPQLKAERESLDARYMLNELQAEWHAGWRGHVRVARTPIEAMEVIGAL